MAIADFFYYFAAASFYLIAILRLQISFMSSPYSINKCILFILYLLIAATSALSIYYCVIVFITPKNSVTFWNKYDRTAMIVIGGIDFLLNTSLLLLFIAKLKELLATILLHCDEHKLNEPQSVITAMASKLLLTMTRHCILFSFAILVNQCWYILVLLQMKYQIVLHVTTFCFRALAMFSNCVVLLLSFNRNLPTYLMMCGFCHRSLQRCFECCIKAQLRKQDKFLDDTTSSLIPSKINVEDEENENYKNSTSSWRDAGSVTLQSANNKVASVTAYDSRIQ